MQSRSYEVSYINNNNNNTIEMELFILTIIIYFILNKIRGWTYYIIYH